MSRYGIRITIPGDRDHSPRSYLLYTLEARTLWTGDLAKAEETSRELNVLHAEAIPARTYAPEEMQ